MTLNDKAKKMCKICGFIRLTLLSFFTYIYIIIILDYDWTGVTQLYVMAVNDTF